jgi:tetratricopeptide (TPR) repeat protein
MRLVRLIAVIALTMFVSVLTMLVSVYNSSAQEDVTPEVTQEFDESVCGNLTLQEFLDNALFMLGTIQNYQAALTSLNCAILRDPNYSDAYSMRGFAFQQLGDGEAALRDFDRALALNPVDELAHRGRGAYYYFLPNHEQAEVNLSRAIFLNNEPGNPAFAQMGYLYVDTLQDFAGAIPFLARGYHILNPNIDTLAYAAFALYQLERYDEALRAYEGVILFIGGRENLPEFLQRVVAEIEAEVGRQAANPAACGTELFSGNVVNTALEFVQRGNQAAGGGDNQEAIRLYDCAIHIDPIFAEAYNNRGFVRYQMGETDAAIADMRTSIDLDPWNHLPWVNLGAIYLETGDLVNAEYYLGSGLTVRPDYGEGYYWRGQLYDAIGIPELALADLNQAIQQGLTDPLAAQTQTLIGEIQPKIAPLQMTGDVEPLDESYIVAYSDGLSAFNFVDYPNSVTLTNDPTMFADGASFSLDPGEFSIEFQYDSAESLTGYANLDTYEVAVQRSGVLVGNRTQLTRTTVRGHTAWMIDTSNANTGLFFHMYVIEFAADRFGVVTLISNSAEENSAQKGRLRQIMETFTPA